MKDHKLQWIDVGSPREVWKGPIFSIDQIRRKNPAGRELEMVVCQSSGWVTVIPELEGKPESEFLMVRQYRHGSGQMSCEFPAGIIDPGERAVEAARRELLEETGFTAKEMIEIGSINPNPAFMSNRSTTFLARGLEKTHELNLDDNEFIQWKIDSFSHIREHMGKGEYDSAIMVQAWYWYLKSKKLI